MKNLKLLFCTIMVALTFAVWGASSASQSDKISKQRQLIATLEKQVAAGEREVSSLRKGKAATERRVRALAQQVETRNRLLTAQQGEIDMLKNDISESDKRQGLLMSDLEVEQAKYGEMVREAYRNYKGNNILSYIFTAEDFVDVAKKVVALRTISTLREERMTRIKGLSIEVSEQRLELAKRKEALERAVAELEQQKAKLEHDADIARKSIKTMSSQEKKILQERELQQRKLDSAISELRKLTKGNTSGASFTAKTSNLNLPVVGGRVKRYIDNMAEVSGAKDAKVVSIYEGKVVDVKSNRITGKYDIYIAHGEYITSYGGLSRADVAKDGIVKKGQQIGIIGQSVDIITMQTEFKIVFGIYPPNPNQKLKAADCFKK
ncbi:MAG: peptidoglycan DD-metalloendopeptidase family protein [Rikenellaceae bacterium]